MQTDDSNLLRRRPFLACFLLWLATAPGMLVGTTLIFVVGGALPLDIRSAGPFVLRSALTLWFLILLHRQGWLAAAGFNAPRRWRQPELILIPLLAVFLNPLNLLGQELAPDPDLSRIAAGFIQGLSIALFEETTYRGLVLVMLLQRFHGSRNQVIACVLGSSLLFGLYHLPTNAYWQMNAGQILYTTFLGTAFAAVALRTRSIWLPVTVHTLLYTSSIATDVLIGGAGVPLGEAGALPDPGGSALRSVLALLPLLFYGLYLLRGSGKPGSAFPPWQ